jgi:maleamate amidohydrolase
MPDATGPFTGRLGFGRAPALVVVDMVTGYTDPDCELYIGEPAVELVASIARLVDAARAADIPVVYTGVSISADGSNGGIFFRKVPSLSIFQPGGKFAGFVPELSPRDDETVIMKQYPSALCGTPLAAMLNAEGVDSVILCGVSTSGCIRATATDVMQHGFIPLVVREAVGDRHPGPHEANLFDIDAKIGDVVSEAETVEHLASL